MAHFPKDPTKFEFDESVADIFENMAIRSIPNYGLMHDTAARMVVDMVRLGAQHDEGDYFRVLDVGASRGRFCQVIDMRLRQAVQRGDLPTSHAPVEFVLTDASSAMLEVCEATVRTYGLNATAASWVVGAEAAPYAVEKRRYGAIAFFHVLQFIPPIMKREAVMQLSRLLRCNGVVFFAEKQLCVSSLNPATAVAGTDTSAVLQQTLATLYYEWRHSNGYSWEEIRAKSEALKNVMFLQTMQETDALFAEAGAVDKLHICRTGQFAVCAYVFKS
jgi:tRNA (cmo5U34)-methyltransferase